MPKTQQGIGSGYSFHAESEVIMNKRYIAPSLLSADFARLSVEIHDLERSGADILHLDLMDGHYVPNLSFGYPVIASVTTHCGIDMDAHLMVTNPADYVERLAKLGVKWISFHQECEYHSHRLVHMIKELGIKAGIALNPATPLISLDCILPDLDFVLLMSVNPGYSGQSFITAVLEKVAALKSMITERGLSTLIEVDGGVTDTNSAKLWDAGADILVSASYIFNSGDYAAAIKALRN